MQASYGRRDVTVTFWNLAKIRYDVDCSLAKSQYQHRGTGDLSTH